MTPRTQERTLATDRAGMTLFEVLVALVILTGALLSLGTHITRFSQATSEAGIRATATTLAVDRLEQVKNARSYAAIDSLYETTEPAPGGLQGWTRQTIVTRVGGDSASLVDYRVITVVVSSPALRKPVQKTTIIADF